MIAIFPSAVTGPGANPTAHPRAILRVQTRGLGLHWASTRLTGKETARLLNDRFLVSSDAVPGEPQRSAVAAFGTVLPSVSQTWFDAHHPAAHLTVDQEARFAGSANQKPAMVRMLGRMAWHAKHLNVGAILFQFWMPRNRLDVVPVQHVDPAAFLALTDGVHDLLEKCWRARLAGMLFSYRGLVDMATRHRAELSRALSVRSGKEWLTTAFARFVGWNWHLQPVGGV